MPRGRPVWRLTAGRLAWLRQLAVGPAHRPRGPVGFQCMTLGWTEWNYLDRTGRPISLQEAVERWGMPGHWQHVTIDGERLTDAGRAILRGHDGHDNGP